MATRKKSVKSKKKTRKGSLGGSRKQKRETWRPSGRNFRSQVDPYDPLRIEVSPDLHWVLPFLEKTHRILPRLQMPLKIRSLKPSLRRRQRTLGTAYYDEGVINIATHHQIFNRVNGRKVGIRGVRKLPRSKILETLAHELAHLHVAEHNFEHAEMTRTIFRTFGLKAKCPHCEGKGRVDLSCNPH